MEVRNRKIKKQEPQKQTDREQFILSNEFDWDFSSIAKNKLARLKDADPDGLDAPKLTEAELRKVKHFQEKVRNLEYKRISSKYTAKRGTTLRLINPDKCSKSDLRKVYDTISPLISVFVTLVCCLFGTNYFLQNIIHDFAGRFAIGLVIGSILAIIEIYFILKRFQAEWDQENVVKF